MVFPALSFPNFISMLRGVSSSQQSAALLPLPLNDCLPGHDVYRAVAKACWAQEAAFKRTTAQQQRRAGETCKLLFGSPSPSPTKHNSNRQRAAKTSGVEAHAVSVSFSSTAGLHHSFWVFWGW